MSICNQHMQTLYSTQDEIQALMEKLLREHFHEGMQLDLSKALCIVNTAIQTIGEMPKSVESFCKDASKNAILKSSLGCQVLRIIHEMTKQHLAANTFETGSA